MKANLPGGGDLPLAHAYPVWPICLALLAGLVAGVRVELTTALSPLLWVATGLTVLSSAGLLYPRRASRIGRLLPCITLCLAMLSLGLWRGQQARPSPLPFHELDGPKLFQVRLEKAPEPGRFSWRGEARLIAVWQDQARQSSQQRVYVEFKNDDTIAQRLRAGDLLWLRGTYGRNPREQNPHAFNITRWNAIRGYAGTIRAYRGRKPVYGHEAPGWRLDLSAPRAWMLSNLRQSGLSDDALALVAAMTLAEKSAMNPELKDEFRNAGLAHILVLSGLHTGFVFLILTLVCMLIPAYPRPAYLLRELLPIVGLWLFVALCGFSLSLVRAAVMISFVALGGLREVHFRPLEMLLLAAAAILLVQPLALWDVGFQLSFSALWGIFCFAWPISRGLRTRSVPLTYIKGILSGSLAAQLGTLPFMLYHFGTLPLLSILGNLFGIPLTAGIVPLGLVLALLPGGTWVSLGLGLVEGLLANILIWLTSLVQAIPALQLPGMRVGPAVFAMLLGASLLMGLAMRSRLRRQTIWLKRCGLALLLLALGTASYQSAARRHINEYRVLYGGRRPLVLYRQGGSIRYLMDSTRSNWRALQDYASDIPAHTLEPWPMHDGKPMALGPTASPPD